MGPSVVSAYDAVLACPMQKMELEKL